MDLPWGRPPWTNPGTIGSDMIATVNYHSSFLSPWPQRVRAFRICFTVYACLTSISAAIPPRTNQLKASRTHFINLHILQVKTLPCIQCIPWLNRFFSSPSGNASTPSRRSVASDTLRIQPAVRSCSPLTR